MNQRNASGTRGECEVIPILQRECKRLGLTTHKARPMPHWAEGKVKRKDSEVQKDGRLFAFVEVRCQGGQGSLTPPKALEEVVLSRRWGVPLIVVVTGDYRGQLRWWYEQAERCRGLRPLFRLLS